MANCLRTLRGGRRGRRGLALLETVLILPMLLMLTFGILEYGWLYIKSGQVNNAARHGVRTAVLPDATMGEVADAIEDFMTQAGFDGADYSAVLTPGTPEVEAGESLRVTITVDYEAVALTNFPLLPTPSQLRGEVSMAKEGPG